MINLFNREIKYNVNIFQQKIIFIKYIIKCIKKYQKYQKNC